MLSGPFGVVSVVLLGVLRHVAAVTSPGQPLCCVISRITLPDFRARVGVMGGPRGAVRRGWEETGGSRGGKKVGADRERFNPHIVSRFSFLKL